MSKVKLQNYKPIAGLASQLLILSAVRLEKHHRNAKSLPCVWKYQISGLFLCCFCAVNQKTISDRWSSDSRRHEEEEALTLNNPKISFLSIIESEKIVESDSTCSKAIIKKTSDWITVSIILEAHFLLSSRNYQHLPDQFTVRGSLLAFLAHSE